MIHKYIPLALFVMSMPLQADLTHDLSTIARKIDSSNEKYTTAINQEKPCKLVKLAKSSQIPYGIWFDPTKWRIMKNFHPAAELSFALKDKEAYAFMINEKVEVSMDMLVDFVLENITNAAEVIKILQIEERVINDLPITYLRVDATINDINISYLIYLFSNGEEIIQLFGFSHDGKYLQDLESFINGLCKVE